MLVDIRHPLSRFTEWLSSLPFYGLILAGVAALIVGGGSGGVVLLFKASTHWLHEMLYVESGAWLGLPGWWVFLIPALGGLFVGLIRKYLMKPERHHGVAGIMEAVALAGGRLPYFQIPVKMLGAVISIGSGASVGPEDPSVQIGANLGSMIGQLLRMSDERTRVLVATGAASGIAAAFNAPIAGVFFAIELILGEFTTSAFGIVVLGAVISAVLTRAVYGPTPAFPIPAYALNSPWELPLYLGLGVLAALVSTLYIRALYLSHDGFHHCTIPGWVRPVLVGTVVGLIGLRFPQTLGDSHEATGNILIGIAPALWVLLALIFLKIITTALSLGAGFMGGVFAPSLLLGVALGSAYGNLMQALFPALNIQPSAFGLVGMAAVLAGTVRAPVTAIMLLFEMTNDYRIILPLMFAVVLSVFISEVMERNSVYTLSLARQGLLLRRGRDIEVLEALSVGEIMHTEVFTIPQEMPVHQVTAVFDELHAHGLPVADEKGQLLGLITLKDLENAMQDPKGLDKQAGEICTCQLVVAYTDDTVSTALKQMSARDIGRLPVVERAHPRHLVGWLSRSDIIRAYDMALVRRTAQRHRQEQLQLESVSGADVFEFVVSPGSAVDGRTLSEVSWPQECLVASIQRRRRLIIPDGQTRLEAGDHIAVVAEPHYESVLETLTQAPSAAAAPK